MKRPKTKKRILIYGDSNVWGDNFAGSRIKYSGRWTNKLARRLREKAHVISDGVSGRVAGEFRTDKPHKNGIATFTLALNRTQPDVVIIALGTNDMQNRYKRTSADIVADLLSYKNRAKDTRCIYLLPAPFDVGERSGTEFTEQSERIRQELLQHKNDLGVCIELPRVPLSDGLHFSLQGHHKVYNIVKNMLESYL